MLELRGIAQKEAVEERARVDRRCALGISSIQGLFKLAHVGAQRPRVEPQLARAEEQVIGRQVAAEGVQSLVQEMTGLLLAALRPQIAKQLVAAHATLPRRSEERKQGQGPPLGGRPQRRPGIAVHSETPQSSQPQRARRHVRGSTLVGTGRLY